MLSAWSVLQYRRNGNPLHWFDEEEWALLTKPYLKLTRICNLYLFRVRGDSDNVYSAWIHDISIINCRLVFSLQNPSKMEKRLEKLFCPVSFVQSSPKPTNTGPNYSLVKMVISLNYSSTGKGLALMLLKYPTAQSIEHFSFAEIPSLN